MSQTVCLWLQHIVGTVAAGDEVVAIGHGFTESGDARLQLENGWVSFSEGGLVGKRCFVLFPSHTPEKTGKLQFKLQREGSKLRVTVRTARGLKDMDGVLGQVMSTIHLRDRGKNDVYVVVDINGERKQTTTVVDAGANAQWRGGKGETLEYDLEALGGELQSLTMEVWDEDYSANGQQVEGSDLIGMLMFPLGPFEAETEWVWEGARIIRQKQENQDEAEASGKDSNIVESEGTEEMMYNPLASNLQSFDVGAAEAGGDGDGPPMDAEVTDGGEGGGEQEEETEDDNV